MERYLFEFVLLLAVLAGPSSQLPPPLITTPILPSTAIVPTITATTGNVPSSAQQQQTSQNVPQTLSSQLQQQQPMTSQNKITVSKSQVISTSSATQNNLKTILFPHSTVMPTLPGNIISNIVYCKLLYDLVLMCHAQQDPQWGFIWPNTPAGELAQIPCPAEFQG